MSDPLYKDISDWTRKAVDAYPCGDVAMMYAEGARLEDCGDTLFTFIVRELEEAGDEEEARDMLARASEQILETLDKV